MTEHVPRLPLSLDALMAEAKRRAWRRRALAALVLVVAAASVTFALLPPGSPTAGKPSTSRVPQVRGLANITVPVDTTEREWRHWISRYAYGSRARRSRLSVYRRDVRKHAVASGARVVRLRLWQTTRPPSVDLVVVTAIRPAVYLRDDLSELYRGINGHFMFVEIVGRHGGKIFESALRNTGGSAYIKPGLQNCAAFTWVPPSTPCPVS